MPPQRPLVVMPGLTWLMKRFVKWKPWRAGRNPSGESDFLAYT